MTEQQRPKARYPHRPLTAREVCLRVLSDLREGRRTAREAIDELIARQPIDPRELGLANELVMGVVRHRLTLARVVGTLTRTPWKHISHQLQSILMMGAYQLIWLDGIPPFAAVSEAVSQAKAEGGPRSGNFTNAVLRQLLRQIEDRRVPTAQADPRRAIAVDAEQSCQFRSPVLSDPDREPEAWLADATSHPLWLVSHWVKAFGFEQSRAICLASLHRPPLTVRPNTLKTDAPGLIERLRVEGVEAAATADGVAVALRSAPPLAQLQSFREGLFQPQDRTSIDVIRSACAGRLVPGQCVVDLCAGLGTKTTQMVEVMHDRGRVIASDKDERKLDFVGTNAARLGQSIVEIVPPAALAETVGAMPKVDWILVDVPCSNTGVLARRPEARYRINQRRIENLAAIQADLLALGARLARPGTHLLYSTCSLEPQENEEITRAFAQAQPDWHLLDSQRVFPSPGPDWAEWRDGGYWALWRRT